MTVGALFSPPKAYPGPVWTRNGRKVANTELGSIAGPGHCGWESVTVLSVGWPLGTRARTAARARRFVRDPQGVLPGETGLTSGQLAADARDTGYRLGDLQLWLSPSDEQGAFLRRGDDVERWPRADDAVCD